MSFGAIDADDLNRWDLNRLDSPLLRLPPELRNQIYELVLEVGQINVCFKKFEHWKARTHTNGQRYYETATPGGFFCRVLDRDQNPWTLPPASQCQRGMTLLSSVCRMLYKETVLLPYSLNVWSFDTMSTMERYILKEKRLPRPQVRAIRVVYTKAVLPDRFDRSLGGLDVMLVQGGLRLTKVVDPHDPERRAKTWDISRW